GMGRFLLVRNPVFGRFWVARTVSYVGSEVTLTALVLYFVYGIGGGGGSLALLLLAGTAPSLLGPIAGTVVDRVDARRLMILCDLGQAALIQKVVPRPMLGRVFGAVYGSVFLAEGVSYAAGGLLLEATSARVVYVVAGVGTLLTMLLVYALLPRSPQGASPRAPE
ncbi:MAG: hypothetical protein ACRDTR_06850, partial [Rubrobacter sp.]